MIEEGSLDRNEVHVWFTVPEQLGQESLGAVHDWLSPDEQLRCSRFRRIEDRHRYLVGRALIRSVLSSYLQTDPKSLRFVQNEHGRPELEPSLTCPRLTFSLSKTSGMVVCCIANGNKVGIDVEDLDRRVDVMPLAVRFFAPVEKEDLLAQPESARRRRFFEYWTLKEAYVKALGTGLTIPLNQFWFQLERGALRIAFDPHLPDRPEDWQFKHFDPSDQHLIAVAIRGQAGPGLRVVVQRWLP